MPASFRGYPVRAECDRHSAAHLVRCHQFSATAERKETSIRRYHCRKNVLGRFDFLTAMNLDHHRILKLPLQGHSLAISGIILRRFNLFGDLAPVLFVLEG